jgi:hypothetical protein
MAHYVTLYGNLWELNGLAYDMMLSKFAAGQVVLMPDLGAKHLGTVTDFSNMTRAEARRIYENRPREGLGSPGADGADVPGLPGGPG